MTKINEQTWREGMANSDAAARAWGRGCLWRVVATIVIVPLVIGLLMPAVGSGPPSLRSQSKMNLMQIGLALDTYRDAAGLFPARAICGPDGQPLLSWRVTLLPYFGGAELIKEFHLDEPWDSPHNITLIDRMPEVLQCPKEPSKNETHYLAVTGPGTVFAGNKGVALSDVTDDPGNTIMIVEADHGVIWTKPEELEFDPSAPRKNLVGLHASGAMTLMVDGAARLLKRDVDDDTIRALISASGGEDVKVPD